MEQEKVVGVLGDFITLSKKKNKNLEVTKLIGVTVEKEIITSLFANKNTKLQVCWIVEKGDFVVRLLDVQQHGRIAISIYSRDEVAIVSPFHHVFRVTNSAVLAEFLFLLFCKTSNNSHLLYLCYGGVFGSLSWKNFIKLPISVPALKFQESIVNKYQTVTKYIEIKKRINELLEKQMRAYFHILFDDLKDYEIKSFGELFTIIRGGRPPRSNRWLEELYFCKEGGIPWLKVGDISREYKFVNSTEEQLTIEGFKEGRCTLIGGGTSFSYIMRINNKLKTSPLIQHNCVSQEKL